jgi:hypothetical protein
MRSLGQSGISTQRVSTQSLSSEPTLFCDYMVTYVRDTPRTQAYTRADTHPRTDTRTASLSALILRKLHMSLEAALCVYVCGHDCVGACERLSALLGFVVSRAVVWHEPERDRETLRRGELGDTGQRREPGCRSGTLWCNAAGSGGCPPLRARDGARLLDDSEV